MTNLKNMAAVELVQYAMGESTSTLGAYHAFRLAQERAEAQGDMETKEREK